MVLVPAAFMMTSGTFASAVSGAASIQSYKALQEILLITPAELDRHVRNVVEDVGRRHGFKTFTSYVAKVGRAQFIEIHIVVPAGMIRNPSASSAFASV